MQNLRGVAELSFAAGLNLTERELMLFALVWFVIGIIDELAIDVIWFVLRLTGQISTPRVDDTGAGNPPVPGAVSSALSGPTAVLIPAWREAEVIGATIAHTLATWRDPAMALYVGCYRNDVATLAAAMAASGNDPRLRLVIHDRDGPTTKADCLNRLYAALGHDETRRGLRFRGVVLQDAEDMVHPLALRVIDAALDTADLVQIPVRPEMVASGHWVANHYADEFTESHGKALVVRGALGAAVPAAGVGCGFARDMLERIRLVRGATAAGNGDHSDGPFAAECLTEDYELGMLIRRFGGRTRFLRLRDAQGELIATRSYFPATLPAAVRQKTRWIHGIALQGWDRLGWDARPVELWMALRDRKGPLSALVLAVGYVLIALQLVVLAFPALRAHAYLPLSPTLLLLLWFSLAGLAWRAMLRAVFVAREYGWRQGLLSVLRIPLANLIAIMAGRRAMGAYFASLRGHAIVWDKTTHVRHPVFDQSPSVVRPVPALYPVMGRIPW